MVRQPNYRNREAAPAPGIELCAAAAIAPGKAKVFTFRDGLYVFEMFVMRPPAEVTPPTDFTGPDGLVAYVNDCPHAHAPLDWEPGEFLDNRRRLLLCTMHGASFGIYDGKCIDGPCPGASLTPVFIEVGNGVVRVGR